jgi:hypothetical protein
MIVLDLNKAGRTGNARAYLDTMNLLQICQKQSIEI